MNKLHLKPVLATALLLFINSTTYAQSPQFGTAIAYELGGTEPRDLVVQDLNYDGHLDMVSVTTTKINFLLGDGNGGLFKDNSITMGDVNDIEFADFNNDGFIDMAIARGGLSLSTVTGIDIYLGTGGEAPQFIFKRFLPTRQDSGPVVLGDFNEDGNVDVVAQGVVSNQRLGMGIFYGLGNGTFADPVSINGSRDYLDDLLALDINNDGHLDIIGGGVYLGTGQGKFTLGGSAYNQMAIGDLNNDGRLDIVNSVESYSGPVGIQVALRQADGSSVYLTTSNTDKVVEIAVADFDRDGRDDVLVRYSNGPLVAYQANDDASLGTGTVINTIAAQSRLWSQHFVLADFNEDGFVDMASPDWFLARDSNIWVQLQTPHQFIDTEAPRVVITSARNGDVLAYKHALTATAADNADVIRVEYYLDGQRIGMTAGADYHVKWDTRSVSDGDYALTAIAVDGSGNQATSSVVSIRVNNTKPAIISGSPIALQTLNVGKEISYHAIASGADPITYSLSNKLPGMTLDTGTGVFKWTPSAGQLGFQTVSIQAGNPAGSDIQSFDVEVVDTLPPERTPNIRADSVSQTTVTLAWDDANDNIGTVRYSVYEYIYVSRFSSRYRLIANNLTGNTFIVSGLKPGSLHKYTVQAFDAAGNALPLPKNYPRYRLSHGIGVVTLRPPIVYHPISRSGEIVSASVGRLFKYALGSFGSPALSIVSGPSGMILKGSSLYWVPAPGQEGEVTVIVEGANTEGSDQHTFSFSVYASALENSPPVVVSVTGVPGFDYWPNNTASLSALALDDSGSNSILSYDWSTQSGPGDAQFNQANSADTGVTFPVAGTYQLLLTVSDGDMDTLYPVSYTIYPERAAKNAPDVGPSGGVYDALAITLPVDNTLLASVVIGAETYQWQLVQGPGLVDFVYRKGATNYVLADAFFSGPGEYIVELSAKNGVLESSYTQLVIVNPEPVPVVTAPVPDPTPAPEPVPGPAPDPVPTPGPAPGDVPSIDPAAIEDYEFAGTITEVGTGYVVIDGIKTWYTGATTITTEGDVPVAVGQGAQAQGWLNPNGEVIALVLETW